MEAVAIHDAKVRMVTDFLVGGRRVAGAGADPVSVHNPFDNSELCRLRPASLEQVEAAVEAAHEAFRAPTWRELTGRERGVLLNRLAGLLRRDVEAFATLESLDTGIPI